MKRRLPLILAVPLFLAGCGQSDFEDVHERNRALMEYTCIRITEDPPGEVFNIAWGQAQDLPQFEDDQENLLREQLLVHRADLTPTCDSNDPAYMPWVPQGYAQYLDHEFTYEDAQNAGLVD